MSIIAICKIITHEESLEQLPFTSDIAGFNSLIVEKVAPMGANAPVPYIYLDSLIDAVKCISCKAT